MSTDLAPAKKRAPTLYVIIIMKLLKGLTFVVLAFVLYAYSDNDLPAEYQSLLHHLRLNPERRFFADLAIKVGQLTEKRVLLAALGTLFYSLFSIVEGIGLMFRANWAGWLSIGESAFFIPIEIFELVRQTRDLERHSSPVVLLIILALNVLIVWYLFQNRERLFRHHQH
jgi:uncharacterized membrane protein (DUF2068 family)